MSELPTCIHMTCGRLPLRFSSYSTPSHITYLWAQLRFRRGGSVGGARPAAQRALCQHTCSALEPARSCDAWLYDIGAD